MALTPAETEQPAVPKWRRVAVEYRVPITAAAMVAALASMFVLTSQSGASFATYLLASWVLAALPRWRGLFLDWGFLAIVALLAYLPLTSLWSVPWDGRGAFGQTVRAVLVLTFVVAIAECLQVDWFRQRMTWVVAVAGALAAAAAMWFFFTEPPWDNRLNGLGQLDTHVAAGLVYAVAGICALAWLLASEDRRLGFSALSAAVAAAVLAVAVPLTGSRNAIACGLLGALGLLLAHSVKRPARFAMLGIASAVALLAAGLGAYHFVAGADALILPRGDSYRLGIWSYYVERIGSDGPWFGLGILTDDATQVGGWPVQHPHNLFLAVVWQGGLLALALLLAVIVATGQTLFAHYARPEAKLGMAIWILALPAYLIDGHELVDKIGWTWLLFWLPVGIAVGLRGSAALADARRFGALPTG